MSRLSLFCFILLGLLLNSAKSYADRLVVYVTPEFKPLLEAPCFRAWKRQIIAEGHSASLIEVPKEKIADREFYLEYINKNKPYTFLFIGDHFYQQENGTAKKSDYWRFANLKHPYQQKDQMSLSDVKNFYSGAINSMGYLHIPGNSLGEACRYFQNNVKYRTCEEDPNNKPKMLFFRGKDFKGYTPATCTEGDQACMVKIVAKTLNEFKNLNKIPSHNFCDSIVHGVPTWVVDDGTYMKTEEFGQGNANFYNLASCQAGNPDCQGPNLAQSALFSTGGRTIGVIASINGGGLRSDSEFYRDILVNKTTVSQAMLNFQKRELGTNPTQVKWNWDDALIYYGDPTLKMRNCSNL